MGVAEKNGPKPKRTASGIKLVVEDGYAFKDLNRNDRLDVYEDWRKTSDDRAKDLASKMSIEQIAGLMLYSGHQSIPAASEGYFAGTYGGEKLSESGAKASDLSDQQIKFLTEDNLRHVLVTTVESPEIAARWNNNLQSLVEGIGLGIPANNSSDPRHGITANAEFNAGAGGKISMWPGSLGMTATFDPEIVKKFGEIASLEYRALGIATTLSPQGAFNLAGKTKTDAAVMPYYTISYNRDSKNGENVGKSFSAYIIADLLRGDYGYDGVVCTDWGITGEETGVDIFSSRPWGVEGLSVVDRHYKVIMAGVDQFGGNNEAGPVIAAYQKGIEEHGEAFMRARYEASATRLLRNMFRVGLFENPYLDPENSSKVVGNPEFTAAGYSHWCGGAHRSASHSDTGEYENC